jgi:hypothetical protein
VCDVSHSEPHEIAGPELTVDGQVEQGKLTGALGKLQPDADGPNLLKAQRCFLSDQFAFVPRVAVAHAVSYWLFHWRLL